MWAILALAVTDQLSDSSVAKHIDGEALRSSPATPPDQMGGLLGDLPAVEDCAQETNNLPAALPPLLPNVD